MVSKVLAMLTNYFTLRYSQITICYLDVHPSCKKKIKTRDVFQCQRVQIFTAFFFFSCRSHYLISSLILRIP